MAEYIDKDKIAYLSIPIAPVLVGEEVHYEQGVLKEWIDEMPTADVIEREKIDEAIEEIKHCEVKGLWKPNYKEGINDAVRECLDILKKHIGEDRGRK